MKILLLHNFFNYHNQLPLRNDPQLKLLNKRFNVFYENYSILRLKKLIKGLIQKYNQNISFHVITAEKEEFYINEDIKVQTLSNFRSNVNIDIYSDLVEKVKKSTKHILIRLFKNLKEINFHISGLSFTKLNEAILIVYLNDLFEEIELLKRIVNDQNFDRIILFNINDDFIDIVNQIHFNKKIEIYSDRILKIINKNLKISFSIYILQIFINIIKSLFLRSKKLLYPVETEKENKHIIFTFRRTKGNLPNQFRSIKPLIKYINKGNIFKPIFYYSITNYYPIKEFNNLIRLLIRNKRIWKKFEDKILKQVKYDSIKLNHAIKFFFNIIGNVRIIEAKVGLYFFKEFINYYPPALFVNTNLFGSKLRLILHFCKKNNIPTVFLPHAAQTNNYEAVSKLDYSFLLVAGEKDKNYFITKGEPEDKLIITGRPVYDKFYEGNIKELEVVKDMFDGRNFEFKKKKFPLLLTTNFQALQTRKEIEIIENFLLIIVNTLKELGLIDDLLIKLHPDEDGILIRKIMKSLNVNPVIVKDYDILELVKSSKVLLSRRSTTVLEAMLCETPVIMLDLINLPVKRVAIYTFFDVDSLIIARNQETLTKNLRKLIEDKEFCNEIINSNKEAARGYSYYDNIIKPNKKIIQFFSEILSNQNK